MSRSKGQRNRVSVYRESFSTFKTERPTQRSRSYSGLDEPATSCREVEFESSSQPLHTSLNSISGPFQPSMRGSINRRRGECVNKTDLARVRVHGQVRHPAAVVLLVAFLEKVVEPLDRILISRERQVHMHTDRGASMTHGRSSLLPGDMKPHRCS